jgi:hypothetical protein
MLDEIGDSFPVFIDHLKPAHLNNIRYLDKVGKHCLSKVYEVWKELTLHNPGLGKALPKEMVDLLKSRAPAFKEDRDHIILDMQNIHMENDLRQEVLNKILQLEIVIPTVDSFLENAGDFQDAIKVLRDILLPNVPNIIEGKQPPTMLEEMAPPDYLRLVLRRR